MASLPNRFIGEFSGHFGEDSRTASSEVPDPYLITIVKDGASPEIEHWCRHCEYVPCAWVDEYLCLFTSGNKRSLVGLAAVVHRLWWL